MIENLQNQENLETEFPQISPSPPEISPPPQKHLFWFFRNKKVLIGIYLVILIASVSLSFFLIKKFVVKKTPETEEEKTEETATEPSPSPSASPKTDETPQPSPASKPISSPPLGSPTPSPTPTPISSPTPSPTPPPLSPRPMTDATPPTLEISGPADGGFYDFNSFCFPMYVTDNWPGDVLVKYRLDSNPWSEWGKDYSPCYRDVANGTHTFSAEAKDQAGNTTGVKTRTFSIFVE